MTRQDALRLLEHMLELEAHTLSGTQRLKDLEAWDSLSPLAFLALVDKEFGQAIPTSQVLGCQSVDDLVSLLLAAAARRAA
jgi:acyl carrier protein